MKKDKCAHCSQASKESHLIVVARTQAKLCPACWEKWYALRDSTVKKIYLTFIGAEHASS